MQKDKNRRTFFRREIIKNKLLISGGLLLGIPVVSDSAAAVEGPISENLDVKATIDRYQEGTVPVEIRARDSREENIKELLGSLNVDPEQLRFGPYASGMPNNGQPPRSFKYSPDGEALKVRFESGAGTENGWWDDCEYKDRKAAVISAGDKPRAYGTGEVRLVGDPPDCEG